jgi:hypothetical protein
MKKTQRGASETNWNAVIGKCLAALCIEKFGLDDESIAKKADFLQRMGLSLKDCAAILGTTEQSIHQQKYINKKRAKGNK